MIRILAAASPGEVQVAAVRNDTLVDFAIWRPGAPDGVGDLHRGRVIARVPGMAGSFVALADAEGFLPDTQATGEVSAGSVIGLRVTRAAQGEKGPRLTARLPPEEAALIGAGPPRLIRRGPGAVERFATMYPGAPVVCDDASLVATLRPILGERAQAVPVAFDEAVLSAVAELAEPDVALTGGGRLRIWPTPALVAIDVDAGNVAGEGGSKSRFLLALNRVVIAAAARQIRLRNLSGAIVVDLAGLSVRQRASLAGDFEVALREDPLRPRFLGLSALGLAEIVRPRVHPPLHELLAGDHAAGLAALRAIARESAAQPAAVFALRAAPGVVGALERDPAALEDLARRTGRRLAMQADPGFAPGRWSVGRS